MTTLSKGDKGAAVAILQQLLNYRGADLKADGVFGAKTKRALTAFQSRSADALGKKPSPDGIAGPATWQALVASDAPEAPPPLPPEDAISLKRIATAHPALRGELKAIYQEIRERGVGVRFTDVLRSFAEQDAIFAQGRSRPGAIVTRARGGQSYHNYGLAVDVVLLLPNRQVSYDLHYDMDGDGIYDWDEIVFVFKHHGWGWGGDWPSFKDKPHFEKSFGLSTAKLRHRCSAGDFVEGNDVRLV